MDLPFSSASLVRWPRPSSALRRRRCRFRWWSGHSRLHYRSRKSPARRWSWRPKLRGLQKQRNTDWRGWLRRTGEYLTVIRLSCIVLIRTYKSSDVYPIPHQCQLNIKSLKKVNNLQFLFTPGSLQLIMEAEAEAESIRVSPAACFPFSEILPPDLISLPVSRITFTKQNYCQSCKLLLYF